MVEDIKFNKFRKFVSGFDGIQSVKKMDSMENGVVYFVSIFEKNFKNFPADFPTDFEGVPVRKLQVIKSNLLFNKSL